MTLKELVKLIKLHNDDIIFYADDWPLFGMICKAFDDDLIEKAVKKLPREGNIKTPGKYLRFLCISEAKKLRPSRKTQSEISTGDI